MIGALEIWTTGVTALTVELAILIKSQVHKAKFKKLQTIIRFFFLLLILKQLMRGFRKHHIETS